METKYIFITGGVVSSLGKGITAASLGRLLKDRGLKVTLQKLDPYLNVDPGNMSPLQHGEVFVTDDGTETDLDIGHYERFVDVNLNKHCDTTSGMVYSSVLKKEREDYYEGNTVQVIPHVTNEIKERILKYAEEQDVDVVISEIGGTVGDIEGQPFLEAIRQLKIELGRKNVLYIHVTLLPYLSQSEELKTKPTQHSVKELRSIGIQPDLLIVRTERKMTREIRDKIALFCDLEPDQVIENSNADSIYEIPLMLEDQDLSQQVVDMLNIDGADDLENEEWKNLVSTIKSLGKEVEIYMIAKYIDLKDAYISLVEALNHSGFETGVNIKLKWIDAETISKDNYRDVLKDANGIIIPAGFGDRGLEGMTLASKYARENDIPFLGISMGMHAAIIDLMRNEIGLDAAPDYILTSHDKDVIYAPREERRKDDKRLGLEPCQLREASQLRDIYDREIIYERHRNKYEFNFKFIEELEKAGASPSGLSPDKKYLEAFELNDHPWFIGVQYHPEFISRPTNPHPLITNFVRALIEKTDNK